MTFHKIWPSKRQAKGLKRVFGINIPNPIRYPFAKISWTARKYAIVRDAFFFLNKTTKRYRGLGTFVYGTGRKYSDSGTLFEYAGIKKIERLTKSFVIDNYFAGLL